MLARAIRVMPRTYPARGYVDLRARSGAPGVTSSSVVVAVKEDTP